MSLNTLPIAAIAGAALCAAASAHEVCIAPVVSTEINQINPLDASPALHDGRIAFLGRRAVSGLDGVYVVPALGGDVVTIADITMVSPNSSGPDLFERFYSPDIFGPDVVFAARHDANGIDGIYRGDGTTIDTLVDGSPADNDNALGAAGMVWEISGSIPYFRHAGPGSVPFPILTPGDPMPGGGTFWHLDPDEPSLENGVVTLAAKVNYGAGISDDGVYTWDVETETLNLVANWTLQMPGRTEYFERFSDAHSDGTRVVMVGQSGLLGFGGHQGLYIAPVGTDPATPSTLEVIAELGDVAPGGDGTDTFGNFGEVVVDGDLIVFQSSFGHPVVPSGSGMFAKIGDGPIFRVYTTGEAIDGVVPQSFSWHACGVDDYQIVMLGALGAPPGGGVVENALYIITLIEDGTECPVVDTGGGGGPTTCGAWFPLTPPDWSGSASVRDISVRAVDDMWVVGPGGFTAHWNGSSWWIAFTPPIGGVTLSLEAVDHDSEGNAWAMGAGGTLGVFRWDAETLEWIDVPLTGLGFGFREFYDIEAIAPDDVYVAGAITAEDPTPNYMIIHYDGESWTDISLPDQPDTTYNQLSGISATGPNDVWAVGTQGIPGPYESRVYHYDGVAWTTVDVPQPSNSTTLYDVVAIAPDLVWAAGSQFVSGSGHQTYSLRFDGTSWQEIFTPNPGIGWNFLFSVSGVSEDHVYASGYHYYGAVNEPIALRWDSAAGGWVGEDLEMQGYSTSAWACGTLPSGEGIVTGTVGYYGGGTNPDTLLRRYGRPGGPADLDCDGTVGFEDLLILLAAWGPCPGDCPADLDGDGLVQFTDLLAMLASWG